MAPPPPPAAAASADIYSQPIVISGPSGTGKSTILKRLFAEFPDRFGFSVSHTTRSPRDGERDGEHYHFVTRDAFEQLVAAGGFIEHAQFGDNYYGTSFGAVDDVQRAGRVCVLDIEMEGVKQVRAVAGAAEGASSSSSSLRSARFLFLAPPSMRELERRLRARATDGEDAVRKRLAQAEREMEFARQEGAHDCIVVNDELDRAYREVREFCVGPES